MEPVKKLVCPPFFRSGSSRREMMAGHRVEPAELRLRAISPEGTQLKPIRPRLTLLPVPHRDPHPRRIPPPGCGLSHAPRGARAGPRYRRGQAGRRPGTCGSECIPYAGISKTLSNCWKISIINETVSDVLTRSRPRSTTHPSQPTSCCGLPNCGLRRGVPGCQRWALMRWTGSASWRPKLCCRSARAIQ